MTNLGPYYNSVRTAALEMLEYGASTAPRMVENYPLTLVEREVTKDGTTYAIFGYLGYYYRITGWTNDRPNSWADYGYRSADWDGEFEQVFARDKVITEWVSEEAYDSWGSPMQHYPEVTDTTDSWDSWA